MTPVKKMSITPENRTVAVIEFAEPVNGYAEYLRTALKEFYRRGLHRGAPRLYLEVTSRRALLHLRVDAKAPPTEQQIREVLEFLDIGRVTAAPKATPSTPPPYRRPRFA